MLQSDLFWGQEPRKSTWWGYSPGAERQRNLARDRRHGKGVLGREASQCEARESSKSISLRGTESPERMRYLIEERERQEMRLEFEDANLQDFF